MKWIRLICFLSLCIGQANQLVADLPIEVNDVVVDYAVTIKVPARSAGIIREVLIQRNQSVTEGEPLCNMDDSTLQIQRRAAMLRYDAAQLALRDNVEVRYAETALAETQAELDDLQATSDRVRGAVARNQLRRNRLAVERAELELAQAEKRREQARIDAQLRAADLAVIDDRLAHLRCVAPIDGIILSTHCQAGQWAREGDPLVTVGSVDQLHVHALVSESQIPAHRCVGAKVTVRFQANSQEHSLVGQVDSVDPNRLPGGRFRLHATVKNEWWTSEDGLAANHSAEQDSSGQTTSAQAINGNWKLLPGMKATMQIHPSGVDQTAGLRRPSFR